MTHREKFTAFRVFGFCWLCAVAFFFVLKVGGDAYRHHAEIQPKLADWSNSRIVAELGDYTQKIDCADLGASGLTGYVWVDQAHRRIIFICK